MKKKILLMLTMTVVLVCMLAISAGAETIVSENNIEASTGDIVADYLGEYQYTDSSTHGLLSIEIIYTSIENQTKTGKMYCATNLWNGQRQVHSTYLPADFDFTKNTVFMVDKADVDKNGEFAESEKIKGTQGSANFYFSYTSFEDGVFSDLVNVKASIVTLSYSKYVTFFGASAYNNINTLLTVTYNGKEAVEGTMFVSPNVTTFLNGAFGGDGGNDKNTYSPKFTRLIFEERTGTISFGEYSFCRGILTEIVFLKGTYNLGGSNSRIAFQWKDGTNTPSLENIVIADGVVINSGTISWNVGKYDVKFIGTESQYTEQYNAGNFSALTNATGTVTYETLCYVYGHLNAQTDGDCTTADLCSREDCSQVIFEAMQAHNTTTALTYANGFYAIGVKLTDCTNDGCTINDKTIDAPIMVTDKGYSSYGNNIVHSFEVDWDAINEYEKINNTSLTLGIFAAKASSVSANEIYSNGEFSSKVLNQDISYAYDMIDIKIMGITETVSLYLGAYVIKEDEISYIDNTVVDSETGATANGEYASSYSYVAG